MVRRWAAAGAGERWATLRGAPPRVDGRGDLAVKSEYVTHGRRNGSTPQRPNPTPCWEAMPPTGHSRGCPLNGPRSTRRSALALVMGGIAVGRLTASVQLFVSASPRRLLAPIGLLAIAQLATVLGLGSLARKSLGNARRWLLLAAMSGFAETCFNLGWAVESLVPSLNEPAEGWAWWASPLLVADALTGLVLACAAAMGLGSHPMSDALSRRPWLVAAACTSGAMATLAGLLLSSQSLGSSGLYSIALPANHVAATATDICLFALAVTAFRRRA